MKEKDIIATFGGPVDTLTNSESDGPLKQNKIVKISDRCIMRNEYAVAYENPNSDCRRGHLTIWISDQDGYYNREQMITGRDERMKLLFSECASKSTSRIKSLIE